MNMMDQIYDIKLGEILKNKRIELGLTQTSVAEKMALSKSAISRYEKGERCMTWGVFKKFCDILKLKPEEVVTQVFNKTRNNK